MKNAEVFGIILLQSIICISGEPQKFEKCLLSDYACLTTQGQKVALDILNIDKLPLGTVNVANNSYIWSDVVMGGFKDAIIDNITIDMELKVMRVLFHTTITIDGHHKADDTLLNAMRVVGEGWGKITLTNLLVEILFLFDIVKDGNGKDIMDLKSYFYGYVPVGGVRYEFENLYNGDKEKSDKLQKIVNEMWITIISNYGSYFNTRITDLIFEIIKNYMRSNPLEDVSLYKPE